MNATYKDLTDSVFEHETRKFFVRAPEKVRTKLRAKKRPASTPDPPRLPTDVDWKRRCSCGFKDDHALAHFIQFDFNISNQESLLTNGLFKIQNKDRLRCSRINNVKFARRAVQKPRV